MAEYWWRNVGGTSKSPIPYADRLSRDKSVVGLRAYTGLCKPTLESRASRCRNRDHP
ncbi:Uncharacterised protein [Vibrio cholerae]|nr:Uncharacterised protein [Vibrio cholerae]CSI81513.1 Uncharacterised protein [Vibrio cholerae]